MVSYLVFKVTYIQEQGDAAVFILGSVKLLKDLIKTCKSCQLSKKYSYGSTQIRNKSHFQFVLLRDVLESSPNSDMQRRTDWVCERELPH